MVIVIIIIIIMLDLKVYVFANTLIKTVFLVAEGWIGVHRTTTEPRVKRLT